MRRADRQARAVSPAGAAARIESGQHLFLPGAAAAPHGPERAIAERAMHLHGVLAYQLHEGGPEPLAAPLPA